MEATRFRFGAIARMGRGCRRDCRCGCARIDSPMRQARTVSAVTPVIAREVPAPFVAPPASIPPGAVSLPMLVLNDGKDIRVGQTMADVIAQIGHAGRGHRAFDRTRAARPARHAGVRAWRASASGSSSSPSTRAPSRGSPGSIADQHPTPNPLLHASNLTRGSRRTFSDIHRLLRAKPTGWVLAQGFDWASGVDLSFLRTARGRPGRG